MKQRVRTYHGHNKAHNPTPTYRCWAAMLTRCTNQNNPAYKWYGAKGITVCDRWRLYPNFLDDMGERPSMLHSLDRYPDKAGNYEPGNCRWATRREQCNNQSKNVIVHYRGTDYTIGQLADLSCVAYSTLRKRLRLGWTVEDAVNKDRMSRGRRYFKKSGRSTGSES